MNLSSRVTKLNDASENTKGSYVFYWMQMFKRASHNYALNFAIQMANERRLPLIVYEGLTFSYSWANDRFHTFILEGVAEKQAEFAERGRRTTSSGTPRSASCSLRDTCTTTCACCGASA